MLTVFIVPSCKDNANVKKTIASFTSIDIKCNTVPITNWREVNDYNCKGDWYGIVWDNECIDNYLKDALPIYFSYRNLEALILYKKISMVDAVWRYRFFRKSVYLKGDFAPQHFWLSKEVVLDGWILEHDYKS